MEDIDNKIELNPNEIEFIPEIKVKDEDISLDFQNLEIDEDEILLEEEICNEYDEFLNYKEYREIFSEYLDVKKSNINEAYSNPLYFIKKIIYFYNKETFLDCYFLYLKSPPHKKLEKPSKYISLDTKIENGKACLFLDLKNQKFNATIKPDNKVIPISFIANNNSDIIGFNKKKNPDNIQGYNSSDNIKLTNNSLNEFSSQKENNFSLNENTNTIGSNETSFNDMFSSQNNTFLSFNDENLTILIKENNDNLLGILNKDKLGGETFEMIALKTFELMAVISLNRNITVKNYNHKNQNKINSFFKLEGKDKINDFQIDLYIKKLKGKELKKIYEKFQKNFFFFENLNIEENENYEVIGEVSNNIINNARQKIAQQFNYIHIIKEFNNYKKKEEEKFISLCKSYELNNIEKILILFTDGSYIKIKYLVNIINENKNEIESLINEKKDKKDILKKLEDYIAKKEANILKIDIEKFYNFCIFYNNLKCSGIKFCFCFISDIIEDKLENRIEERIKNFFNDEKKTEQNTQENENGQQENIQEKKPILELVNYVKKNIKLKQRMMSITDELNKKIKEFVDKKNRAFKKLDEVFNKFNSNNYYNFFLIAEKIMQNYKIKIKSLTKKIYSEHIFLYFIFFVSSEFTLNLSKIKNSIKNSGIECSYEIIHKANINEIEKEIKSRKIKNKICVKIFIAYNEKDYNFLKLIEKNNDNNLFYYFNDKSLVVPITEIIKAKFEKSRGLYVNEFYQNNKTYFDVKKNNKEILSKNNITQKIIYDLNFLNIKKQDNMDNIIENISFNFDEYKEFKEYDEQLLNIGNCYFESLVDMIKQLLVIAKIKKNNNVMEFVINKEKFMKIFINLIENIKFKCFYQFFWLMYMESLIVFDNNITFKNIEFSDVIQKK